MDGTVRLLFILLMILPFVKSARPGSFFWKPRLGLQLSIPTTTSSVQLLVRNKPSAADIRKGVAVIISGYQLGLTVVALASNQRMWAAFPHLNPFMAWFYTTAYRWGIRHLSLIPEWLRGSKYTFVDTHRVWRKRFYYNEWFVPEWLQRLLPHVWQWDRERKQFRRYLRYADPAFAKHMHYPKAVFDDWRSEDSTETVENLNVSHRSADERQLPDY